MRNPCSAIGCLLWEPGLGNRAVSPSIVAAANGAPQVGTGDAEPADSLESHLQRAYHRPPLRLVTFDRRGHRRLGALLDGKVVDLPDLVGHPAFPSTMEHLVKGNGGTVLDAARAALERDEAEACVVDDPRLLAPILPTSLRSADASEGERPVFGPEEEIPWPAGAGWLEFQPKIAAVLRRGVRDPLAEEEIPSVVLGYTLVGDWLAFRATGSPMPTPAACRSRSARSS